MKDAIGNDLAVGDRVAYFRGYRSSSYAEERVVTGFTTLKVQTRATKMGIDRPPVWPEKLVRSPA